jgi:hypothetical protein
MRPSRFPHALHLPRLLTLGLGVLLLLAGSAGARWVDLGGGALDVTLLESDGQRSVLEVTVGGFEATPVDIDGATYYTITLPDGSVQQMAGMPALPDVRRSLIIPDDREMTVTLQAESHIDLPDMPVAPSKGNLPRTIDPATVPYTFDAFYQGAGVYPPTQVEGHEPFILRDFRGMVADLNVFQYLPAERTLRVYTRMRIEIAPAGPGKVNVLERTRGLERMDPSFAQIYERRFINYDEALQRYTPVPEDGSLLIITYDSYLANVTPLYQWKLQKGLKAKLVTLSQTGSTATQIKAYIQNEYNTTDLAYVLLIGDSQYIPVMSGGSDPLYALVAGGDSYPDIFVGRFSAENAGHVDTQVQRTIHYERDIVASESWPQMGCGVASDQGPGHFGEYDFEHMNYIRDDLLAYGYTAVDQIYDPGATAQMVANALNAGRGIVNYCGHGDVTLWGTTGFSNSHVNALTNYNKLPFICSVACLNGSFIGQTCFAEAWLRANQGGEPTGAIACYMSVISQSWDPPMYMEDEAVDLLVADEMRTIGGLWFNGSCYMIEQQGSAGVNEFNYWTIFGDPSLHVRTKQPQVMTVNHTGTLLLGQNTYAITIPGVSGALCALYADGTLYGAGTTNAAGQATITLDPAPAEPMNLLLTVTAYNKETYIGDVEVIPAEGPYLLISDVQYLDAGGDGLVNAGESVQLRVKLRNVGIQAATNVSATLTCGNPNITLTQGASTYPNLAPGAEAWCNQLYAFSVSPQCPDMEAVAMPVVIAGDERLTWEGSINFVVHAPTISIASILIDDSAGGNGNMRLDPGETATVAVTLMNAGSGRLDDITGVLTCSHPMVTVTAGTGSIEGLGQGQSGLLQPIYEVTVDPAFPAFECRFDLRVTGSNQYDQLFEPMLPIGGFFETVEGGAGEWTHYVVTPTGFTDQWHVSTQRNHTPGGTTSWKCGATGTGNYANLLDAGLETPAVTLNGQGELVFWMWMRAEVSSYYQGKAYDGGLIEMSLEGGPWEQITPVGGYTHTIRTGSIPGPFPADTPVFSGTIDWTEVHFDLAGVEGEVSFRFRFGSDGATGLEGWYIDDIEILGLSSLAGVEGGSAGPVALALMPSRPNPAAGQTTIAFALPQAGPARLEVFDASGRLVRTLVAGTLTAGDHRTTWDGADALGRPAPSGLYYYRLSAGDRTERRTLVLMR